MNPDVRAFNESLSESDVAICNQLANLINKEIPDAENKIWHRHPVWFLNENPIVGYSRQKAGIRLMFWSGASFDESDLKPGTGKFKDASKFYTALDQLDLNDLRRWLSKAKEIQWDYKNIYKRKGKLVRLK